MGEWKKYKVEDIQAPHKHAMSTGPFGSAISSKYFKEAGVPIIRGKNLSANISDKISEENLVFLSQEKADTFSRSKVRKGDLIFTCWGTIDQIGYLDGSEKYSEFIISNKQMKLTVDDTIVDSLFMYYYFSTPQFQQKILNRNIGSSVPGFNLTLLKQMEVILPTLTEQQRIVHTLSLLDAKIDLLRQQNETLEALGAAVFREWFLEGEKVSSVADVASHLKKSIKPGKNPDTTYYHYSLPAYDAGKRSVLEKGEEIRSNKYEVVSNCILVSKLNPRFPRVWLVTDAPNDAICSTEFQVFKPEDLNYLEFLYFFFKSPLAKNKLMMSASGTSGSHQRVRPQDILDLEFSYNSYDRIFSFAVFANPLIEQISQNEQSIIGLENTRDLLLPKLMSGQVKVRTDG